MIQRHGQGHTQPLYPRGYLPQLAGCRHIVKQVAQ